MIATAFDTLRLALARMMALTLQEQETEREGPEIVELELAFIGAGREAVSAWAELMARDMTDPRTSQDRLADLHRLVGRLKERAATRASKGALLPDDCWMVFSELACIENLLTEVQAGFVLHPHTVIETTKETS